MEVSKIKKPYISVKLLLLLLFKVAAILYLLKDYLLVNKSYEIKEKGCYPQRESSKVTNGKSQA